MEPGWGGAWRGGDGGDGEIFPGAGERFLEGKASIRVRDGADWMSGRPADVDFEDNPNRRTP